MESKLIKHNYDTFLQKILKIVQYINHTVPTVNAYDNIINIIIYIIYFSLIMINWQYNIIVYIMSYLEECKNKNKSITEWCKLPRLYEIDYWNKHIVKQLDKVVENFTPRYVSKNRKLKNCDILFQSEISEKVSIGKFIFINIYRNCGVPHLSRIFIDITSSLFPE